MIQYCGGPLDGEDRVATSPQPELLNEEWPRPNAPVEGNSGVPCFHLYRRCDFPTRYLYCGVQAADGRVD